MKNGDRKELWERRVVSSGFVERDEGSFEMKFVMVAMGIEAAESQ